MDSQEEKKLRDDLIFKELGNKCRDIKVISTHDLTRFAVGKFIDIVKSKGYSSPTSNKAKIYLNNRVFVTQMSDNIILAYAARIEEGEFSSTVVQLHKISIRNEGLFYVIPPRPSIDDVGIHICYRSHLFDRFAQRLNIKDRTRLKSIREFYRETLGKGEILDTKKFAEGKIRLFQESGVCLGDMRDNIAMVRTFVDTTQLRNEQKNSLENEVDKLMSLYLKDPSSLNIAQKLFVERIINE